MTVRSVFLKFHFLILGLILASSAGLMKVHAAEREDFPEDSLIEDESTIQNEMDEASREVGKSALRQPAAVVVQAFDLPPGTSLSKAERLVRLEHAHELLGKHYRKSVVRNGERVKKINGMVYRWTRNQLPARYRKQYKKIAQTIIDQSLKYEFDPIFLMSVISNESKFDPSIIGSYGEIGLMQILPATGKWIAEMNHLPWRGKKSLRDPASNIQLGAWYLAYLRNKFDSHARLYLAAYNMGQRNVQDALEKNIWPRDYAANVMRYYIGYYSELQKSRKTKIARNSDHPIKMAQSAMDL